MGLQRTTNVYSKYGREPATRNVNDFMGNTVWKGTYEDAAPSGKKMPLILNELLLFLMPFLF